MCYWFGTSSQCRQVSLAQRPLRRSWPRREPEESFVKVAIFVCVRPGSTN